MKTKIYTIKPLVWLDMKGSNVLESYCAHTIFGSIYVQEMRWEESEPTRWHWSYCVDEYYDEGDAKCESREDGMAKAEEWYIGRLSPALEPKEVKVI